MLVNSGVPLLGFKLNSNIPVVAGFHGISSNIVHIFVSYLKSK